MLFVEIQNIKWKNKLTPSLNSITVNRQGSVYTLYITNVMQHKQAGICGETDENYQYFHQNIYTASLTTRAGNCWSRQNL